ncbi:MAG: hypothetical protein PVH97_07080 [Desulfobacterales bacterium]|jgi:hypothetical protein
MANSKSKSDKMKIKVKTKDGAVEVKGNNGEQPDYLSEQESQEVYNDPATQRIGEILFRHSSPGCVYYYIGGRARRICS